MPVEITKTNSFFKELLNPPDIVVFDAESYQDFDEISRTVITYPEIKYGSVNISPKSYSADLNNLFDDFIAEFNNNRFIQGFSLESYVQLGLRHTSDIKSKFSLFTSGDKRYIWRKDLRIKYRQLTDEIEYYDDGDNGFRSSFKSKLTVLSDYSFLPDVTLKTISTIVNIQKQITVKVHDLLHSYSETRLASNKYGTSYPFKFFKFKSLNDLGDNEEVQELKKEFLATLAESRLVSDEDFLTLEKYFDDLPSMNKVTWKGNKRELFYFITRLIDEKIIENPLREKSRIIAHVFCDKDGRNFKPTDFHNIHRPIHTQDIENIISILKR